MLHCLALGTIVYYAAELLHNTLDNELVIEELEDKVRALEGRLDAERWGGEVQAEAEAAGSGSAGRAWWRLW